MRDVHRFTIIVVLLVPLALTACVGGQTAATPTPTQALTTGPRVTATSTPTATHIPVTVETAVISTGETATLVEVIDGDTIDVEIDGEEYRVRYEWLRPATGAGLPGVHGRDPP